MQQGEVFRLELPAQTRYFNILSGCIAEILQHVEAIPDREHTIYSVQLAVHEGCANIVDHAYRHEENARILIEMSLQWNPLQFVVDLYDVGMAFNPENVREPHLDDPQVRGYGLYLMRQIMDEVSYYPLPGQNRWRLVKNLYAGR
jgi:serine/threonine-protein kinase RsbW